MSARKTFSQLQYATVFIAVVSCFITIASSQQQQGNILQYEITENQQNTKIADLIVDYKLNEKYSEEEINNLSFVFIQNEPDFTYLFASPIQAGILQVKSPVDRDNICPNEQTCVIQLDIKIQPSQYFEIIKIQVVVNDLNDNGPVFEDQLSKEFQVSELAPTGTTLTLPQAVDRDSPQYGIQFYEIQPSSNTFRLLQDSSSLQLEILQQLDREEIDMYTFQLIAFDGGSPAKTSAIDIVIRVTDINDNSPVFIRDNIQVNLDENISVDSFIVKVTAEDKDEGESGVVTYSFDETTLTTDGEIFQINPITGEITVKSPLDYETKQQHILNILAKDNNPNYSGTAARVTITVNDINDNQPSIKINDYDEGSSIFIAENSPPDYFVAHLTVNDLDSGDNGDFDCSFSDNNQYNDFQLERLYDTEFKITTSHSFDRELIDQYTLQITCSDKGSPVLFSSKVIPIVVSDINDVSPVFTTNVFHGSALESIAVGSHILSITATDPDLGDSGEVEYHMLMSTNNKYGSQFSVGVRSGNITLTSPLDREREDSIQFLVTASDKGTPALTSTATVVIEVVDEDDNLPMFPNALTELSVLENELPATEVGFVIAEDIDSDNFNQFTYNIEENDFFAIDANSGLISTKVSIDREINPSFQLQVFAITSKFNPSTSSAFVVINIEDKNDHDPLILFPNPQNNTVHVSNSLTRGEIVTYVRAKDSDEGINALITYSIIGGNTEDYFIMDSNLGAVMVHKSLSDINLKSFGLIIKVKDNALPPRTAEAFLNIVVNKSLSSPQQEMLETKNLSIAISIACISGFIIVILMVAITIILRQRISTSKNRHYNYTPKVMDRNVFLNSNSGSNTFQNKTSSSSTDSVFSAAPSDTEKGFTNFALDNSDVFLKQQLPSILEKNEEIRTNHIGHDFDADSQCSAAETDSGRGSNEDSHEQIRHHSNIDPSYQQLNQKQNYKYSDVKQHPDVIATAKQANPLYGTPQRQTSLSWQQPQQNKGNMNPPKIYTKQLPVGNVAYNSNNQQLLNTSRDSTNHLHLHSSDSKLAHFSNTNSPVQEQRYRDSRRMGLLYREHNSGVSPNKNSSGNHHGNVSLGAQRNSGSELTNEQYLKLSHGSSSVKPKLLHEVHV